MNPSYVNAKLIDRVEFTPELAIFRFLPEKEFHFTPGQFVNLAIEQNGEMIQRAYSITSSTFDNMLEFFIELLPEGKLTPLIWDLEAGNTILIREQVFGKFTLQEKFGLKKHLMVATVTGIAPFISILRTIAAKKSKGEVIDHTFTVLHGASNSLEFGTYKDELVKLAGEGWLNYIPTVSQPLTDLTWSGEVGRVEDILRKYGDQFGHDHNNSVSYACGHPEMIENVKKILLRARFPKEKIKEERYFNLKSSIKS